MTKLVGVDQFVNLVREGYLFMLNRRKSLQTDVFETRFFGKKAICMGGREAAKLFYDNEKFERYGAAPNRVRETLFGDKGVQTLDGQEHRHRKAMFMDFMKEDNLNRLQEIVSKHWEQMIQHWEHVSRVVLYDEMKKMLCAAACEWAGVPIHTEEIEERTKALSSLFESPAKFGPGHWKGRYERNAVESWLEKLAADVREHEPGNDANTLLHQFSFHRDMNGELLPPKVVAVEVINVIRPIIAIAIYVNFMVLALEQFPKEKSKLERDFERYVYPFIHEVRRYYPFFPFVAARVKQDFVWKDFTFQKGTLTYLDIYGTNHDPELWENPERFDSDRFLGRDIDSFQFIPQGGGDYLTGHRCAGEKVTIEVMKTVLDRLLHRIDYELPEQDYSYSLVNIPSIPKSKIILENIRKK